MCTFHVLNLNLYERMLAYRIVKNYGTLHLGAFTFPTR